MKKTPKKASANNQSKKQDQRQRQRHDDILTKMREMAITASEQAYSPYSKAKVGSVILTEKGNLYFGCNVENGSYGATICAERNAICNMVAHGERKISKVYVFTKEGWPPCGLCRQVIREFSHAKTEIIMGDEKGIEVITKFDDLYPLSFGPEDMDIK